MKAGRASVLLLTEDSGDQAFETIEAILKRLLVATDCGAQTIRLDVEPLQNEESARAVHGNIWKSDKQREQRAIKSMLQDIASKLLEDDGFVVFHIDGDVVWSGERPGENERKFEKIVRLAVRIAVQARLASDSLPPIRRTLSQALESLLLLIPHFCIEAWLYQNTDRAKAICQRDHAGRHVHVLDAWAADRTRLDEVDRPKSKGTCCLGAEHNLELATEAFPTLAVLGKSPSFTEAVHTLRGCRPLMLVLNPYLELGT